MRFNLLISWTGLLALIALIWISRHSEINRAYREQIPLTPDSFDGPPSNPPLVTFLVAAKDEEKNIEQCVRTLLDQDYPHFEVIAVNDRSDDRTGAILDGLDKESDRLTVVHVSELREGWFGKNNAMREGVSRAKGDWLAFTDADCVQTSPKTLSMAMRQAVDNGIEFLSVLPVLDTPTIWERIIQPVCGAVLVFWFHPRRVNDPKSKVAYANGAFMLMTRKAYDGIGGHEAVKTEMNEDMHMARLAKSKSMRLVVLQNRGLYRVRMYTRFVDTWRGWSRIFFGCFGTFRRLAVSLSILTIMTLLPWFSATVAWAMTGIENASSSGFFPVALAASFACLMQLILIMRFYKLSYEGSLMGLTYPLGAMLVFGMLINAMLKLGGRSTTVWRGTTYRGDQVAPERATDASRLH
jgi:chlorobactene glucosyltransferase